MELNSAGEESLSVVIPAYNAAASLARAISSAFAAGASEVIVVDDGSTDETSEVASANGARLVLQTNSGAAAARRRGVAEVSTTCVVLCDADDALVPSGVTRSVALLQGTDMVAIVGGFRVIDAGAVDRVKRVPPARTSLSALLHYGHAPAPPAAVVWRTDELKRVLDGNCAGVWPRYAEDYELLVRGALLGRIGTHSDIAADYQFTGGKSSIHPQSSIRDAEKIRLHYAEQAGLRVHPRSRRALWALALRRQAQQHPARSPRGVAMRALSHMADPANLVNKAVWRLRPVPRGSSDGSGQRPGSTAPSEDLLAIIRADWRANPRDWKARMILLLFRCSQALMGAELTYGLASIPVVVIYRLLTEGLLGLELRPKTRVGSGLTMFHAFGIVVNDHSTLGSGVVLRHGVTIGHRVAGGRSPVIGNNVEFGAGSIVIGDISIGDDCVIGAGAVVLKSMPARHLAVGNPAVITPRKLEDA